VVYKKARTGEERREGKARRGHESRRRQSGAGKSGFEQRRDGKARQKQERAVVVPAAALRTDGRTAADVINASNCCSIAGDSMRPVASATLSSLMTHRKDAASSKRRAGVSGCVCVYI
jgi:hypothetical protein